MHYKVFVSGIRVMDTHMAEFTLLCTIYNRKHMVAVYYIALISRLLFMAAFHGYYRDIPI